MNADVHRDIAPINDTPVFIGDEPSAVEDTKPSLPSWHRRKIKIIFLAVNDNARSLQLDEEYRKIDLSVSRQQDRLELVSKLALRLGELQQGLLQHTPDIVHFGGHGTPAGELMLRDDAGALSTVSPDALRSLFAARHGNVRLVILNACFSAEQARAIRDSVGLAVGMRRRISDRAAIAFAAAFYEALAYRCAVREAFDLGIAAIKMHGVPEEADVPELLVRPGLNASRVYLIASRGSASPTRRSILSALQTRRAVFIALLLAAIALAVLFGSGVLRQNVISEYVVLVLLGCLAGILAWGILSSSGEISGSGYGISVKLGGSSVTVILTIAGGLWLTASEGEFAVKIKFVDETRQPVNVNGTTRLEIDAYTSAVAVKGADLVELGQLPRRMVGRAASLTLESAAFRLGSPDQEYRLQPGAMFVVRVRPVSTTKISGTVSFEGTRMPGAQISVVGHDCGGNVRDGFFEMSCEDTSPPIKVQVRVPELYTARVCTREVLLKTFTSNEIILEGCASPTSPTNPTSPTSAPSPTSPTSPVSPANLASATKPATFASAAGGLPPRSCPARTPEDLIRREADLVRQHDLRVTALFTANARIIDAQAGTDRSPRDRYRSEFASHQFKEASHANIQHIRSENGVVYYTSSSRGKFDNGDGYNNPGPSDHWILENVGDCWRIKTLIINAAHDGDQRFARTE